MLVVFIALPLVFLPLQLIVCTVSYLSIYRFYPVKLNMFLQKNKKTVAFF